jgi:hypothetical protein
MITSIAAAAVCNLTINHSIYFNIWQREKKNLDFMYGRVGGMV